VKTKFLLAVILASAIINWGLSQSTSSFEGSIILGVPSDHSIAVKVTFANDLESVYLEYGENSGEFAGRTPEKRGIKTNVPYEEVIQSLQPDRRYYYRLRYRKFPGDPLGSSAEHSFHTQRAPGSPFTFCIQGDSHPERASQFDPNLYIRTLQTAAADQPDFYMTIGDDFSVDTLKTVNAASVAERYTLQLPYLGLLAHSAPLFLVNGNHEQAARYLLDGTPNNVAVWAQNARNKFYPQPGPDGFYTGNAEEVPFIGLLRNYYAWEWGDALFVTIDPYWSSPVPVDNVFGGAQKTANKWDVTHGDAQYDWLKRTLENSKARWKFVFAHHVIGSGRGGIELAPYFEWGGYGQNNSWAFAANRPGWAQPIHQLMAANHVTIFFQGHDHLFVRQQLDGVTYQELPEPADPTYTLWNEDAYTSGDKFSNTGYVRVGVSPSQVRVDYVRTFLPLDEKPPAQTNGMVQFSYAIRAGGSLAETRLAVPAGGAVAALTAGEAGTVRSGYATVSAPAGNSLFGAAVFSLIQDDITSSECGVPASPLIRRARLFVDWGNGVVLPPEPTPVNVTTGIALANPGADIAHITFTLLDGQGRILAVGHGMMPAGAHRALYLDQFQELAPDFSPPADFSTNIRYGTLEVSSDRPMSIMSLRLSYNQRGQMILSSMPLADLDETPSAAPVYFPQIADGDGTGTGLVLLNTTDRLEEGWVRLYDDQGAPLTLAMTGGGRGSSFRYSIVPGGLSVFQTDGSSAALRMGSVQVIPDAGTMAPTGAGLFHRSRNGALVTEAGVPRSPGTTRARIFVDLSGGHDTGLALAAVDGTAVQVELSAYRNDGTKVAGVANALLDLPGNGHRAAFAGELLAGLPAGFRGVLELASPRPFAAVTLRSLTNARGDFLLTTFPVADLTHSAQGAPVFPQIADAGGYRTEIKLLNSGDSVVSTLSYFGNDGSPLHVGSSRADFALHSPVVEEFGTLPSRFTCDGSANTLPLSWENEPEGTQSFAVIMDSPSQDPVSWYWLVWDIPSNIHTFPENKTGIGTLGGNSVNTQGGYTPPCFQRPGGMTYTYTVYALSSPPQLKGPPQSVTRDALLQAIGDRTLGSAALNVTYSRR
jgi:phosphatidylethanolamine-binding protein (PEBP) family uncharacterized protein